MIEIIETDSPKTATELMLQHGRKVPRDLSLSRFELEIQPTREEKESYRVFLQGVLERKVGPEEVEPIPSPFWGPALEVVQSATPRQKKKIFKYGAGYLIEKAREFKLPILRSRSPWTASDPEHQIGILRELKRQLGKEVENYLFGISRDGIIWFWDWKKMPEVFNLFVDDPDLALKIARSKVLQAIKEAGEIVETMAREGLRIDLITMTNDLCDSTGLFEPIKADWVMDKFIYPLLKMQIEGFRELGISYVIKHTDGNVLAKSHAGTTVLERLIGCGIDGFHPVDPSCLDIKEVKETILGREGIPRICLLGGIDISGIVALSETEFRQQVLHCLKWGGYRGGYIPGSSNVVLGTGKGRQRYDLFLNILEQFGRYSSDGQIKIK